MQTLDPRMVRQMQAQAAQQQKNNPTPDNRAQAREKANPLPPGTDGLQVLRGLSDCTIPDEANAIKQLLEKTFEVQPEDVEDIIPAVGESLAAITLANLFCAKHKTRRPVVRFEDDDTLNALHTQIRAQTTRFKELQRELMGLSGEIEDNLRQRWHTAVKKFGLAPEKYSYELNDEEGTIYIADLDCAKCTGKTKTQQARLQLANKLLEYDEEKAHAES